MGKFVKSLQTWSVLIPLLSFVGGVLITGAVYTWTAAREYQHQQEINQMQEQKNRKNETDHSTLNEKLDGIAKQGIVNATKLDDLKENVTEIKGLLKPHGTTYGWAGGNDTR